VEDISRRSLLGHLRSGANDKRLSHKSPLINQPGVTGVITHKQTLLFLETTQHFAVATVDYNYVEHMARKRDKIKKVFSPPPAESNPASMDDQDGLEDDLFAQLDARDAETRKGAAEVLQNVRDAKTADANEKSKKDSKSRFQVRAVILSNLWRTIDSLILHRIRRERQSNVLLNYLRQMRLLMHAWSVRSRRRKLPY
jgi:hypothetical protein